jgi:hypothetical protein
VIWEWCVILEAYWNVLCSLVEFILTHLLLLFGVLSGSLGLRSLGNVAARDGLQRCSSVGY